jgi:hypothetical protein
MELVAKSTCLEVIPGQKKCYHYMKTFEMNPIELKRKLDKICGVQSYQKFKDKGVIMAEYDCENALLHVVYAEGGSTVYLQLKDIDRDDYVSIIIGLILGGVFGFIGGYYANLWVGIGLGLVGFLIGKIGYFSMKKRGNEIIKELERL